MDWTAQQPQRDLTTQQPQRDMTAQQPQRDLTAQQQRDLTAQQPHRDLTAQQPQMTLLMLKRAGIYLMDKPERTRREKRDARRRYRDVTSSLHVTPEEFQELQQQDISLEKIQLAAEKELTGSGVKFFIRDGLICRRWILQERDEETEQLVVPVKCRRELLKLAYTTPFAGHLGRTKTTQRLLQRFYWPGIFCDVAGYCRSCSVCQKAGPKGALRAPLIPLPIIATPFKRIAKDIVGPLPKSRLGKRYILVVCDYATHFREAIL
uniref:Integrase zinc-binding domain-containing protein n=1 Tax=Amphimedon queenslandica TaxID=400682 RepID=A0A1X7USK3_AMPQE